MRLVQSQFSVWHSPTPLPQPKDPEGSVAQETIVVTQTTIVHQTAFPVSPPVQNRVFQPWPEWFKKPLNSALQRFEDFAPLGTITAAQPYVFGDNATKFSALSVDRNFAPFVFQPTATTFVASSLDLGSNKPFPAVQQQFSASFGYLAPSPFVPWNLQPWPEQFAKPFNAALQRIPDFAPASAIQVSAFQPVIFGESAPRFIAPNIDRGFVGFVSFTKPVTLAFGEFQARFVALRADRQFAGFIAPQPTVTFVGSEMPTKIQPASSVSRQQFSASFVFLPSSPFVPWNLQPWPERLAKPINAALQRVAGWPPLIVTIVAAPSALSESQWPERFSKSFPAYLQQFSTYAAQPISNLGRGKRRPLLLQGRFNFPASYWPDGEA